MINLKEEILKIQKEIDFQPKVVEITTVKKLSSEELGIIKEMFGENITLIHLVDTAIVAGFRLRLDDTLFDYTAKNMLEDLKKGLKSKELSKEGDLIKEFQKQVSEFKPEKEINEVGSIIEVKDGIALIEGLPGCKFQEVLILGKDTKAMALNLDKKYVGAVILGDFSKIKAGDFAARTGQVISTGVGEQLIGRVINSLGDAIDGGEDLEFTEYYPLEKVAPGVIAREPVDTPLQTGIKAIDALIPVGRGQRELILGDRQTGKTTIAIDAILNQKREDIICIYVAIGQKDSKVAGLVEKLRQAGAMDYTIVVNAAASEPAPMLYLAPYTGVAIAEYFADKGKEVLIVYDDLSKHAVAYRELSLLLRRPPGREAYPGDVFYLHSRLLERAVKLSKEYGGGSITALPIIETQAGDISAYIPTNVISITDGQIFLESELFYREVRPAINVGLSVSRVGGAAQIKPMKKVAGSMKIALAQYRELEAFSQFASDLDPKTKEQLERGRRTVEMLKQKNYSPVPVELQVLGIYAVSNGYFDKYEVKDIKKKEAELAEYASISNPKMLEKISKGVWDEEIEKGLKEVCENFVSTQDNGSKQ